MLFCERIFQKSFILSYTSVETLFTFPQLSSFSMYLNAITYVIVSYLKYESHRIRHARARER